MFMQMRNRSTGPRRKLTPEEQAADDRLALILSIVSFAILGCGLSFLLLNWLCGWGL